MSDSQLIEKVAELWVELGGDSEGVTWCWTDLRDKVQEIENENKERETGD